jgi:hypothetical protein
VGIEPVDAFVAMRCRNAQRLHQQNFPFDQFQSGLPPDWIAIILLAKVGIGPVGVRP